MRCRKFLSESEVGPIESCIMYNVVYNVVFAIFGKHKQIPQTVWKLGTQKLSTTPAFCAYFTF